ncbi:hypothetical protein M422DRAFT_263420 [Sphaerobolus stellatus SS14]|uniref:Uncharacterized protein n=1 Tax=Sphaerobolus stellatus (strain SS14) TaxID=990650 RepID=A0A0C9UYW7_SPHS4|nr:hypothetical protein M422DRAFT_263420 [Sphaerobolus stellatus SS14]
MLCGVEMDANPKVICSGKCLLRFQPKDNDSKYCIGCSALDDNESLACSLHRAVVREAEITSLSEKEKMVKHNSQVKLTSKILLQSQSNKLEEYLNDERIARMYRHLEENKTAKVFLDLFHEAQISETLADRVQHVHDQNPNALRGIWYDEDVLSFFVALRSYGNQSSAQYGLLKEVIGGVCHRQLHSITAKNESKMDGPDLSLHNIQQLVNMANRSGYKGIPVVLDIDCTVVKRDLSHCSEFGSHPLGSLLPLEETTVKHPDDIDRLIQQVVDEKARASQVRTLAGKIPLPGLLKALILFQELNTPVLSTGGDGASSEVKSHKILNSSTKEHTGYISWALPKNGLCYEVLIFATGPLRTSSLVPESICGSQACFHLSRTCALREDIEKKEGRFGSSVMAISNFVHVPLESNLIDHIAEPSHARPTICNLLHPVTRSRTVDRIGLPSILTSTNELDYEAAIRLQKYQDYMPQSLQEVSKALESEIMKPNEISHHLQIVAKTTEEFQALTKQKHGGYSRQERWVKEAGGNGKAAIAASTTHKQGNPWTVGTAIIKQNPQLNSRGS